MSCSERPSPVPLRINKITRVEVIAGVNLPMLIKLASLRGNEPLASLVVQVEQAGRKYINVASRLLETTP